MTGLGSDFLGAFFAPPNALGADAIDPATAAGIWLEPWIDRAKPPDPLPTVLPRVLPDQSVSWYAMAFTTRQFRGLGAEIYAFAGPSYSTFDGRPADLDNTDPIDVAVAVATEHHAFRFRAPNQDEDRAALRGQLELMRTVWSQRPERVYRAARPVGRVLRDFELAIATADDDASAAALDDLRARGDLSAHNLLFLTIRRYVALGQYQDVLALDELATVLTGDRPRLVTQDLIRAVYAVHLSGAESTGDARAARDIFDGRVIQYYGPLYRSWGGMVAPEALKNFMLAAGLPGRPDHTLRDAILSSPAIRANDRAWLEELATLVPGTDEVRLDDVIGARSDLRSGHYDRALRRLQDVRPSAERAELLIETALNLDSVEATSTALDAVRALPGDIQQALVDSPVHGLLYRQLLARPGGKTETVPRSWLEWLSHLGGVDDALQLAESGAPEWSLASELTADSGSRERFVAEVTATRDEEEASVLRDAVPLMIASLGDDADPALRNCYSALVASLTASDALGLAHLAAIQDLQARQLGLGLTDAEYREIVRDYVDLWSLWGNASAFDWLLDAIDLLAEYGTPGRQGAAELLAIGAEWARHHAGRLRLYQWGRLRALADEAGIAEIAGAIQTEHDQRAAQDDRLATARSTLAGQVIGIYTLTERAGRQAAALLEEEFPGTRVEVRSDLVATPALEQLARGADVFVFAWRSAKHAAAEAIEQTRPAGMPLLRAAGKGASSLVRAVHEFVGLA